MYLDCPGNAGQCIALCFMPPLGLLEWAVLERQVPTFGAQKAVFVGVVSEQSFFFGPWQRRFWPEGLTLLSDPLGRLSRQYGVPRRFETPRCHSFLIDAEGLLRYHLVHDLNGRGMGALLEILKACRSGKTPQPDAPRSVIQDRDERMQPLLATRTQGD
jgi:alkyl hydroperoxide reductase subunit AhpC